MENSRDKSLRSRKFNPCDICGDAFHPTPACPLTTPSLGTNSNGQQVNFFVETGGGILLSSGPSLPPVTNSMVSKPRTEIDDRRLFVGHLPQSVDVNKMRELFSTFGPLRDVKLIKDKSTGLNKGYGFVWYTDHNNAVKAMKQMNGYKIDGKKLMVQKAGALPPPSQTNKVPKCFLSQPSTNPGAAAITQKNHNYAQWPGPLELRLPESHSSFSDKSSLSTHSSSFNGQYLTSLAPAHQTQASTSQFSGGFARSDELTHFLGPLELRLPESHSSFSNNSLSICSSSFNGQSMTSLASSHQTQASTSHISGGFARSNELAHIPGPSESRLPESFFFFKQQQLADT